MTTVQDPPGAPGVTGQRPPGHLSQVLHLRDLVALSVSSVGPLFSIAATGGVMAADAGVWTIPAIGVLAVPFLISAFVFRLLNRHYPHAGASYHWSGRVLGRRSSHLQAWILILAYFTSIPPIVIPAASYTLALVAPHYRPSAAVSVLVSGGWAAFALIPLLLGARPTARLTQLFLALELLSVAGLVALGAFRFSALRVPVHFGAVPVAGVITVAVVAGTILDGWEIDSYASEEAVRPRSDPGMGGIIGAFMALGFYALIYPLMFAETPLHALAGATDPLAVWGARLVPGAPWLILIPVLGSTAGGMWLTSFILIRALYSMGREGLIPRRFGGVDARQIPRFATLVVMAAAMIVVALQTLVSSLSSFFTLVLSTAGFFLIAEFFLDSLTATVFLRRVHRHDERTMSLAAEGGGRPLPPHGHRAMYAGASVSTLLFGSLLIAFLGYGPSAVGGSIDVVIAALLGVGVLFVVSRRRTAVPVHFAGDEATVAILRR